MRIVSTIGVVAALLLVAGGVVAPGVASADGGPTIDFTTVDLFNPTDFDTIPGYLQVQIGVTYTCPTDAAATPTMQGTYGPANEPIVVAPTCDGTQKTGFVYARVPVTEGADPVEAGGSYSVSVGLLESPDGGSGSGESGVTATVSGVEHLPALTDMFPPYFFRVRRSVSHPASQALVSWDPPLTTGSHTLTGFDVRDPDIGLRAVVGPTTTHYVVKHLKAAHTYSFGMSALATDFATITTPLSVKTAHKAKQAVSLRAARRGSTTVRLSGHVRPTHGGHVTLERRVHGHWTKVALLHLHRGSYHRTVRRGPDSYQVRVVAVATPDFKRSASRVVTVAAD
jgi:hypothetical protein